MYKNDLTIIDGEDFIAEVTFRDEAGRAIGVPDYDFEIEYYCYENQKYTASRKVGVCTNCHVIGDKLVVTFDHPVFGGGILRRRAILEIPDARFDDGFRRQIETCLFCRVKC